MNTQPRTDTIAFRARIELGGTTASGIEVPPDVEPRVVTVPPDFAAALDGDRQARQVFDGMSYSHRLRWVLSVEDAKTDETRRRRIAKAVDSIRKDH